MDTLSDSTKSALKAMPEAAQKEVTELAARLSGGDNTTPDVASTPSTDAVLAEGSSSAFSTEDVGEPKTLEFRRFLVGAAPVSAWHDVPVFASASTFNAVIEIKRGTTAKMEMATTEARAPIKQDVKKGKLRDYAVPIEWNYGAFPQTWEQPDHAWPGLEALATKGDNDPLDVVDLSTLPMETGSVVEMKLLGVLAMIDEGEVDWKVVAINVCDPKAALVNCLADAETHFPGQVDRIREWFTWYKAVDGLPGDGPLSSNKLEGKEPNVFGFDGKALDVPEALNVLRETHRSWAALVAGTCDGGKLSVACNEATSALARTTAGA